MFRLLRITSVITFIVIGIVVAAALLTLFYRRELIRETVHFAQVGNVALAQATLVSIRPELDRYLAAAAHVSPHELATPGLSARFTQALNRVGRDASLTRVKLYNRRGLVIFSTERNQIGQNESGNEQFRAALNGQTTSDLKYRDIFDLIDGVTKDSNLMATYVPVRVPAADSIEAVFEIYTDATPLVAANERAVFTILGSAALVLMLLYAVIALVVRHMNKSRESR